LFHPDPRLGDRQIVCGAEECKRQRKEQSQQYWLQKNPDYFKGRYMQLRQWLDGHPGYLKRYRLQHTNYRAKNQQREQKRRAQLKVRQNAMDMQAMDMQDKIVVQHDVIQEKLDRLGRVDIQDEISVQLLEIAENLSKLLNMHIQDEKDNQAKIRDSHSEFFAEIGRAHV
jgi:hypothetical protein